MFSQEDKDKSGHLSNYVSKLWLNPKHSDITFCIEGEKLPAHRLILASREHFCTLLYGPYAEGSQNEIKLEGLAAPYKSLFKYIYFEYLILSELKLDEVVEVMNLAQMYNFNDLTAKIELHLTEELSMETVGSVLTLTQQLKLDSLTVIALNFLDKNASQFLQHDSFTALSLESVCTLMKRDTFEAPEHEIFFAAQNWSKDKSAAQSEMVLGMVRLSLMSVAQLLNIVQPLGVVQDHVIHNAIREQINFETNNASDLASEAKLVRGNDGDNPFEGVFFWHERNKDIVLKLPTGRINHIQLWLVDVLDDMTFQYSIEVSDRNKQWVRVVDHTQYQCRSRQYLYFPCSTVKYIRLIGTDEFYLNSLKAFHIEDVPYILHGFSVPRENVATHDRGAIVRSGVNGPGLLFDTYTMSATDCHRDDYTSHRIAKDEMILLRFGQPYHIESIRMLLYGADNRTYRFYVETSVDNEKWEMAVDMRETDSSSICDGVDPAERLAKDVTDVFTFEKRLVVWIKIVGTKCSIENDKEFRCVRFMSPAYPGIKSSAIKRKRA